MLFRVLGPLSVSSEGATLGPHPGKEGLLLACLLAHPNRVVSSDALVDALWPDGPSSGRAVLPVVSRLRRMLDVEPGGRARLVTRPPGYRLELADHELDASIFEEQTAQARRTARNGQFDEAADLLSSALDLWRGPAFAAYAEVDLIRVEAARLEELHHTALEDRVDAGLALGRHHELVAEVEMLVELQPLRERRWAQLMLALYRAGRQTDALRAYERLRRLLVAEVGVTPAAELVRLHQRILGHDRDLQPPTPDHPRPRSATPARRSVVRPENLRAVEFVGRATEMGVLHASIDAAISECSPRIALVRGEAGAGKTALLAEASHRAAEDTRAAVVYGRCAESGDLSYGPFVSVVDALLPLTHDDDMASGVQPLKRLIAPMSALHADLFASTADADRRNLFHAISQLIEDVAEATPVVIVLDDLHWADEATLNLLTFLLTRPLGPVTFLCGLRQVEAEQAHPLRRAIGAWYRTAIVDNVVLGGLPTSEIGQLLTSHSGLPFEQRHWLLAEQLQRETDGNPFFVTELIRHLRRRGGSIPPGDDGRRPALAAGIPQSVRDSINARISTLSPAAGKTLTTAAVLGPEFDVELLVDITGLPVDTVTSTLLEAERGALLLAAMDDPGRIRFAHALIERVLYDQLGVLARALQHGQVARALLARVDRGREVPAAVVAGHLLAAAQTQSGWTDAAHWARRAGDEAAIRLAPEDARHWYVRALSVPGGVTDELERARCLLGLGNVQRRAGGPYRRTLLDASRLAARLGAGEIVVKAAMASSRGFASVLDQVDRAQVQLFETAIEFAQAPAQRAELLAALAAELIFDPDPDRRAATVRESLVCARAAGDDQIVLSALLRLSLVMVGPDALPVRHRMIEEAMSLAHAGQGSGLEFMLAVAQSIASVERFDIDQVLQAQDLMHDAAHRLQEPILRWFAYLHDAWRVLLMGDPEAAERSSVKALAVGTELEQPDADTFHQTQLFHIRWHQGRFAEMLAAGQRSSRTPTGLDGRIALALALVGDQQARSLVDRALEADFPTSAPIERATDLSAWGLAVAEVGDRHAADRLTELLAAWPDLIAATGLVVYPSAAHILGRLAAVLGRRQEAVSQLRMGLDRHQSLRAPFFLHLSEQALAECGFAYSGATSGNRWLRSGSTRES